MKHRGVLVASGQRLRPSGGGGGLVPPGSIDGTGATNVTASLQAWIDAQPDGSTFNFTGKTYRIDQQLNLINRTGITMLGGYFFTDDPTGDGSTLASPSPAARNRSHWDFKGSTNILVDGMTVRGANALADGTGASYVAALEAQIAFNMSGCVNVEVKNCTVSYVYGDWFYLGMHPVSAAWCDGVNIHHNTCSRSGRQGVSYTACRNSSLHHNDCQLMARAFVDLEPNFASLQGANNIEIYNNTVGYHRFFFVSGGGLGPVDNVNIHHNTCVSTYGTGPGANLISMQVMGDRGSRENWTVDNNIAFDADTTGGGYFQGFFECKNVIVTNNTQPTNGGVMTLAYFQNCEGVVHQGNTIPNGNVSMIQYGSTRIRNCGNRLSASGPFNQPEVCVTDFGTPKQYSGLTAWYDAYQAADADLAAVSSVTDWSGNNRHLVAAGSERPTFRTNIAGMAIRSYLFDGVDDFVESVATLGNFITASTFTMFIVFTPGTVSTGSATVYNNDAVLADSGGMMGLYLHSTGPKAQAYNYDGTIDVVERTLTPNHRVVVMMRHEAGNLYIAKDGGAESLIATGNTFDVGTTLWLGCGFNSEYFTGTINEVNVYNVALTTAQILDRTNRLFLDWKVGFNYGAVDTFTRADGAIGTTEDGHPWVEPRGSHSAVWSVVSNKAKLTAADPTSGLAITVVETGLCDCTVQVDVDMSLGGSMVFRAEDGANWSCLHMDPGAAYFVKDTDDSFTFSSAVTSGVPSSGIHTLKAVLLGSSVKLYIDATLLYDLTSTHMQTATQHGLFRFASTPPPCTWDNFSVVA